MTTYLTNDPIFFQNCVVHIDELLLVVKESIQKGNSLNVNPGTCLVSLINKNIKFIYNS